MKALGQKEARERDMQEELYRLRKDNRELREQLERYRKRDKPMLGDFLKTGQKAGK